MKRKVWISTIIILISLIAGYFAWDAFTFFEFETVSEKEVEATCIESSECTIVDVQIRKAENYPGYLFAICSVETDEGTMGDELYLFEKTNYLGRFDAKRYRIKRFSQAVSSTEEVGSLFCELNNADNVAEKTLLYFSSNRNGISTVKFSFENGEEAFEMVNEKEAFVVFIPDSEKFEKEKVFEIEFSDSKGEKVYAEISKSGSAVGNE